jgi:DNA-binding NarL/FixJ family response regulator
MILKLDLKNRLENLNYEVVGMADTGYDAIEQVEKLDPDVVLMDIVLKGELNGIETAQLIKDKFNTLVIYMSAYYDDEILDKAAKTQPDGYITKPYEDVLIRTTIEIAMRKRKYQDTY